MGGGADLHRRTVIRVAKKLNCALHTFNDAADIRGEELFEVDKQRLNRTSGVGFGETSSVKLSGYYTC
jgi:hypothetical protein